MLKHSAGGSFRESIPWQDVVARGVPEILSAGYTKRKAASRFAASRRQEQTQMSAPRRFSAGDNEAARRIVADRICRTGGEVVIEGALQTYANSTFGQGRPSPTFGHPV